MRIQEFIAPALLLSALAVVASCGGSGQGVLGHAISARMGENVNVGRLIYKVIEVGYRPDIPGAKQPVKSRVLAIRLSIMNPTPLEVSVPALRLVGADGEGHLEFMEIENSTQWLGMIRRVQPNATDEGIIYFDISPGVYKLELVDNTNPDKERVTLVELPSLVVPPARVDGPRMGN